MKNISRRDFLKLAGITLGASTAACCGLGYAATHTPESAQILVETPSFHFGDNPARKGSILVTYATRTGSTVGVAECIGKTLSERTYAVDVKPVKDDPSLTNYQAVIMGSAINQSQWLPEAVEFVRNHQSELQQMPAMLFCVHIMNLGSDETSTKNRLAYLDEVRALIQPTGEAFFAGMMNLDQQSWLNRWAFRTFDVGPEGDHRDWNLIRAWARNLSLGV